MSRFARRLFILAGSSLALLALNGQLAFSKDKKNKEKNENPIHTGFEPTEVPAQISRVLIPGGHDNKLDDNDNVEVIVVGTQSACDRVGRTSYSVKGHDISVQVTTYKYTGVCVQMAVGFTQKIRLGVLASGSYSLSVNGQTQKLQSSFSVKPSKTADADDYFYAPVKNIEVVRGADQAAKHVVIKGEFPRMYQGCMRLGEVYSSVDPSGILVIQPTVEIEATISEEDTSCSKPFSHRFVSIVKVPETLKNTEFLVHVRAMNGDSLNYYHWN